MKKVVISDIKKLEELKEKIAVAGKGKLHIIADFDRTLTCSSYNGEKVPSLISVLRDGNYLTPDYAKKAHELFDKYRPIEIDPNIPALEKNAKMSEWWSTHYRLLVKCGLDKNTIKQAVKNMIEENKVRLRPGVKEFLKILKQNSIPLVLMSSAGIGDMVLEFLKENNVLYDNIYLIGNMLDFDEQGKFKGIKDNRVVHTFNKQEIIIKDLPIYKELEKRKNIILLGDSIGDLNMVDNFPYENIIKINFLSKDEEENLPLFKANYDVVLLGDGDFSYVNKLVRSLVK